MLGHLPRPLLHGFFLQIKGSRPSTKTTFATHASCTRLNDRCSWSVRAIDSFNRQFRISTLHTSLECSSRQEMAGATPSWQQAARFAPGGAWRLCPPRNAQTLTALPTSRMLLPSWPLTWQWPACSISLFHVCLYLTHANKCSFSSPFSLCMRRMLLLSWPLT
jgi:hypothetical protein